MILERFLNLDQASEWGLYLPAGRNVFSSAGFARVCARHWGLVPRLYVAEAGASRLCYPLLLRPLGNSAGSWQWEAATPEFTGPDLLGKNAALARWFVHARGEAFGRERILVETASLHPFGDWTRLFPEGCARALDLIWVDTRIPPREMWHDQFTPDCRQAINAAYRARMRVFSGSGDDLLAHFCRLSIAGPRQPVALALLRSLRDELGENCRFWFADLDGRLVAAALFLHDDRNVYLGPAATDPEFQAMQPAAALVWEVIHWAHRQGKLRMLLGAREPSGAGFHEGFSRKQRAHFLFTRVYDPPVWRQIGIGGLEFAALPSALAWLPPSAGLPDATRAC